MRRALRRYREYSLFLEKYSVGEKTAENNNGLNPKKPLSFGKPGAEGVRRECRDPPHCLTSTPGAEILKSEKTGIRQQHCLFTRWKRFGRKLKQHIEQISRHRLIEPESMCFVLYS